MQFITPRSALLKPLQMICGVVEKKQTMPILANVLITVKDQHLHLTATDLDIELVGSVALEDDSKMGAITVSAKKLFDICRVLPDDALIQFHLEGNHLLLESGANRFTLLTLPSHDFPSTKRNDFTIHFTLAQNKLKNVIDKTYFAMGQQDVRHYLNGALLDIHAGTIKCVATDGHRLACSSLKDPNLAQIEEKIILPRKSVLELMRLLDFDSEALATVSIGENHFKIVSDQFTFISKLINAPYPDYEKFIPKTIEKKIQISREIVKKALTRASILSNEKFRGIRLQFEQDKLRVVANTPEQEEAEEWVSLNYQGAQMEVAFNVAYLLDVMSALSSENVCWSFAGPNRGVLIEAEDDNRHIYVVMPMQL